jgi:acyl carrier protein
MRSEAPDSAIAIVRAAIGEKAEQFPTDSLLLAARIDGLDLDSLTKLELVLNLETRFATLANESEIVACRTIGELIDLVSRSSA